MIVTKTEVGNRVLKDRSVPLTPRQRSVFILVDGRRTVAQLLAATQVAGVTKEDIDRLFELDLITDAAADITAAVAAASASDNAAAVESARLHKQRSPQERYAEAYPIACRLTAALGLRGFRLNLAVEGATNYETLKQVAPRILDAVGPVKYAPLDDALNDR